MLGSTLELDVSADPSGGGLYIRKHPSGVNVQPNTTLPFTRPDATLPIRESAHFSSSQSPHSNLSLEIGFYQATLHSSHGLHHDSRTQPRETIPFLMKVSRWSLNSTLQREFRHMQMKPNGPDNHKDTPALFRFPPTSESQLVLSASCFTSHETSIFSSNQTRGRIFIFSPLIGRESGVPPQPLKQRTLIHKL